MELHHRRIGLPRKVPVLLHRRHEPRNPLVGVFLSGQHHGFFNRQEPDPQTGVSPYGATLADALAFLKGLGWEARP